MNRLILITIFIPILLGCKSTGEFSYSKLSDSWADYRTTKLIRLDTIHEIHHDYIEFENGVSLISISVDEFINYAQKRINDSICNAKKIALNGILEMLNQSKGNHYLIEKNFTPEEYKRYLYPKPKTYKKNFIEPYGYSLIIDTVGKSEMKELKYWMISELCLNGKCLVLDKRNTKYTDSIYYEIIDFKDGHGGESLKFVDKKPFFNVKVYSDIIWPDVDCMTKEEIEEWNKK
ncbi:hypothetical protein [Gaoshiqia sp. Z1-71]|uniref:hypothetical protein n=1 Tax=Gaoshiqia hydrogeniformans TaxID=3290090 RepID=UPI003BF8C51F